MIIYVDLDGTLCEADPAYSKVSYSHAVPNLEAITMVNKLFDLGHEIVIWTARGGTTGLDWRKVTLDQLEEWGVKYRDLEIGNKPYFDMLIDDKAVSRGFMIKMMEALCVPSKSETAK